MSELIFQAGYTIDAFGETIPGIEWELYGTLRDDTGSFAANSAEIGDKVFIKCFDNNNILAIDVYRITEIVSNVGMYLICKVVCDQPGGPLCVYGTPITGDQAISRSSSCTDIEMYQKPSFYVTGIEQNLESAIDNENYQRIKNYLCSGSYSGYSGYSGEQGFSGISGYSGQQGINGQSGYSGGSGISGFSGFSGYSGERGNLAGVVYYLHEEASSISGYELLLQTPANDPEHGDPVTVNSGSGEVLIDSYITNAGDPGQTIWIGGVWHFATYANVDSSTGVSNIVVRVYKRNIGGTETELFNFTTDEINNTPTPKLYDNEIVTPDFSVNSTDRLVVKYYGKTTSGSNRTINLYYEGTQHYSHIHTPFINQGFSGFSGISGYSGFSGINGLSGFSGTSGVSGFSGISGYSGDSGISGYSGISGFSGYSGYREGLTTRITFTQASPVLAIGDAVYKSYSGTWEKSKTDTYDTADSVGIIESIDGNNYTVVVCGYIDLSAASIYPLTVGDTYFVSDIVAGLLTPIEPTAVGSTTKPMLAAISDHEGLVLNHRGIELIPTSGYSGFSGYSGQDGSQGISGLSGYSGIVFIPQITKTFYVDKKRTDIYTEDGSFDKPFKTIMGAVNQVISNGDNSQAIPYTIRIATGVYNENIILEDTKIVSLIMIGEGSRLQTQINPSSGYSLQSMANNSGFYDFHVENIQFIKPTMMVGDTGGSSNFFGYNFFFVNCYWPSTALATFKNIVYPSFQGAITKFSAGVVFSNITQVSIDNIGGFKTTSALTIETDENANKPNSFAGTLVLVTASRTPNITWSLLNIVSLTGTALQIRSCRHGISGETIPANAQILAYNSSLIGNYVNNGTLTLYNSQVSGTLSGTAPVLYQFASEIKNDSSVSGTTIKNSLDTLNTNCAKTYTTSFTNANLVAGILTITHNLGSKYCIVAVYDNADTIAIPGTIVGTGINTTTVDLSSFGVITGIWNVRVVK